MKDWREIDYNSFGPICRVAEVFQIGPPAKGLAISDFKIKILEKQNGHFVGIPNVAITNSEGHPDWISDSGSTVQEALLNTLNSFYDSVKERGKTSISDFIYSDTGDFL